MFGQNFIGILKKDHINIEHVTFTDKAPTSVASIMVFEDGIEILAGYLKRFIFNSWYVYRSKCDSG